MKCLDKKRIKMKQGETLALNERIMLSLVSTGVSGSPPHLGPGSEPSAVCADLFFHPLLGLPVHHTHYNINKALFTTTSLKISHCQDKIGKQANNTA